MMRKSSFGKVYLIGAGPGAQDLMTLRGAKILARADIVFYDALVDSSMFELCPQAKLLPVGKRCGKLSTAQKFIDKQLVDAAKKYDCVVRLKGGDPMIFGRADEELTALKLAGIDVDVVPGITSALAAAASIQSSLTLRGVSRSVAFMTMSSAEACSPIEKTAHADTLIYYMGKKDSVQIATQLIASGTSKDTPVVVVESISTPHQREFFGTLEDLRGQVLEGWSRPDAPAILMIGKAFEKAVEKQLFIGVDSEFDNRLEDFIALTHRRRTA
jgi:uroporphyrin-III C-methyltransferase